MFLSFCTAQEMAGGAKLLYAVTAKRWRWSMNNSKLTSSVNITSPPGGTPPSELYVTDGLSFASKNRACRSIGK